ncbi:colicin-like pore-forming protein [Enterobacter hormaechei]|uniref:colicin-like pore-forming protein n=1 Tax=Enterobacter hormaechei TaxID=158836 RepID=UPI0034D1AF16
MVDYKNIDSTEKNIMESMGYHWNGHGWQRALQGGGEDMIVEGWIGTTPKNPTSVTRIWDQKIGEMNKYKSPYDEDEDYIEPMPDGMKNIYRKESDDKIKYALTLKDDLARQIQQIDKDIASLTSQASQLSPYVSELQNAIMQLSLSKLRYQKNNADLLHKEATKRHIHEQYLKQNKESWFLSLEKPTSSVRAKRREISTEMGKLLDKEKQIAAEIEQINKNITAAQKDVESKQKKVNDATIKENASIKDALKLTSDFYKTTFEKLGQNASNVAKEMAEASKGKQIQSVDAALKAFDKFKNNLNKKYSLKDRKAISNALESVSRAEMARNLELFGKAFGYVSKTIDRYDIVVELKNSLETDNWRPFFVKMESIAAGRAASAITAWTFAVLLGTSAGILGFAIIMAAMGALVNDKFIEQINKLIGI